MGPRGEPACRKWRPPAPRGWSISQLSARCGRRAAPPSSAVLVRRHGARTCRASAPGPTLLRFCGTNGATAEIERVIGLAEEGRLPPLPRCVSWSGNPRRPAAALGMARIRRLSMDATRFIKRGHYGNCPLAWDDCPASALSGYIAAPARRSCRTRSCVVAEVAFGMRHSRPPAAVSSRRTAYRTHGPLRPPGRFRLRRLSGTKTPAPRSGEISCGYRSVDGRAGAEPPIRDIESGATRAGARQGRLAEAKRRAAFPRRSRSAEAMRYERRLVICRPRCRIRQRFIVERGAAQAMGAQPPSSRGS